MMTVFTGLLSIQSIVGTSADTLGVKAAKFVVSNFVPIVGSAVADAYTTMRSGLGLLRGATGAFGIIALCVTLLPPILETLCLYLAMTAGGSGGGAFRCKGAGQIFRRSGISAGDDRGGACLLCGDVRCFNGDTYGGRYDGGLKEKIWTYSEVRRLPPAFWG